MWIFFSGVSGKERDVIFLFLLSLLLEWEPLVRYRMAEFGMLHLWCLPEAP